MGLYIEDLKLPNEDESYTIRLYQDGTAWWSVDQYGAKQGLCQSREEDLKTGEWVEKYLEDEDPLFRRRFYCTACGEWTTYGKTNYCPNCGAAMVSRVDDIDDPFFKRDEHGYESVDEYWYEE